MLTIIIVSLLAISTVNATENMTNDIVSVNEQDDTLISEIDNNFSSNTNKEILTTNVETFNEDPLIIASDLEPILNGDDGTFTALQNKIDNAEEGSTIFLNNDYIYDEGFDIEGISISKKLTIQGNGHTIDALMKSRISN